MHSLPCFPPFPLLDHFLLRTSSHLHLHLLLPSPAIYSPGISKLCVFPHSRGGVQRMTDKTCSVLPRHLSEPRLSSVCRDGSEQEWHKVPPVGSRWFSASVCLNFFLLRVICIPRASKRETHVLQRFCIENPEILLTKAALRRQSSGLAFRW